MGKSCLIGEPMTRLMIKHCLRLASHYSSFGAKVGLS